MLDGAPVRARLTMAGAYEGREVVTLEGQNADPVMNALQEALLASGGVQCRFGTSGVLVTARSLLDASLQPDEAEIRAALSGNLCRCTGYVRIIEAVMQAARQLAGTERAVTP